MKFLFPYYQQEKYTNNGAQESHSVVLDIATPTREEIATPALIAPFIPFDGMNENGVAIALLAVPEVEPPFFEDRVMLNTTTTIRLVLDKAKNVDDAIESNDGILSEMQAVDLLAEVGVIDSDGHSRLHWTVIYNLSTLEGVIFANRNTDNLINSRLTPLVNK